MALGDQVVIVLDAGALTLTPATIPNPGGMLAEVDGVVARWPDGRSELLEVREAWLRFRGLMNGVQAAHLMGWPICASCGDEPGTGQDALCGGCWSRAHRIA